MDKVLSNALSSLSAMEVLEALELDADPEQLVDLLEDYIEENKDKVMLWLEDVGYLDEDEE